MLNEELQHIACLSAIYANLGYTELIKLIDLDVEKKLNNNKKLKEEFKKEKEYFQNYLALKTTQLKTK